MTPCAPELLDNAGRRATNERRKWHRQSAAIDAVVRGTNRSRQRRELVSIEERSLKGVRFRSSLAVRIGDSLTPVTGGEQFLATVVWVRTEGILISRSTSKPC